MGMPCEAARSEFAEQSAWLRTLEESADVDTAMSANIAAQWGIQPAQCLPSGGGDNRGIFQNGVFTPWTDQQSPDGRICTDGSCLDVRDIGRARAGYAACWVDEQAGILVASYGAIPLKLPRRRLRLRRTRWRRQLLCANRRPEYGLTARGG